MTERVMDFWAATPLPVQGSGLQGRDSGEEKRLDRGKRQENELTGVRDRTQEEAGGRSEGGRLGWSYGGYGGNHY